MTFVPLLGYYLLRPGKEASSQSIGESASPVVRGYLRLGAKILKYRVIAFTISVVFLVGGFFMMRNIKSSFFPNDLFTICWVDVWMPEDSPLSQTDRVCNKVEAIAQRVTQEYAEAHKDKNGKPTPILDTITTYVGGSGPRFWSSIMQELDQPNYAQVIVKVTDKHDTEKIIPILQKALSNEVPEALCDVRQLEGGKPVGVPISVRISGEDPKVLHELADQMMEMLNNCTRTRRVRQDWGKDALAANLNINSDRANLAGLTNADIASAISTGINGNRIDVMRERDKQIPIVVRMRTDESAQMHTLSNMYVYSVATGQKVPLSEVATISYSMEPEKFRRRNQFRTVTVGAFTASGVLPSEVMEEVRDKIYAIGKSAPPGYKIEVGGEEEEQIKSGLEMLIVMATSIISIFICLVVQFKSAVKPLIVFAGIPYGMLGAIVGLTVMGSPFGFPAFMGVASLTGVIVSHVIVLFDFIEESRHEGAPLEEALLHASLVRLRPVLITVSATVLGFIPLAMHGGPLWEPLCYAQIGGLSFATFVTLLLVPIIYAIAVKDLKIVKWKPD